MSSDQPSSASDRYYKENIIRPIPPTDTGTTGMSSIWGELIDPEVESEDWTPVEHPNVSRPQTPASEISGSMTSSALFDPTPSTSAGSEQSDDDPLSPTVDGFRRSDTSSPAHAGFGRNLPSDTTASSWTWQDPDSSTGTLHTHLQPQVAQRSTTEEKRLQDANSTSSQDQLIFPVLTASGLSSSDPSLDAFHEELRSIRSHLHDEDITSETPLIESQLDAIPVGTTPMTNRHSFLADFANAARDGERGLSNSVEFSLAGNHEVNSTLEDLKGRRRTVDKDWLEGVARSRILLAGKDESVFESGLISLSDLGYAPLEQQAASSHAAPDLASHMWMDLLPGEWPAKTLVTEGTNVTRIDDDAPPEGLSARSRFEQAKRLAILALPLLAMTIWASFSPNNNALSLFEISDRTNVKESLSNVPTSQASVESFLFKTPPVRAATSTPPPCRALTVHKTAGATEIILRKSNKIQESNAIIKAKPAFISQAPTVMVIDEKEAGHPLALVQKTLATATSGFHARGRQRAASTEQSNPSSSNFGVRPDIADPVATSLLASPTAASWLPAYWRTDGFVNASTLSFGVLGRELQHLASFVRSFLDGLLVKTRKFKEPLRGYFEFKDSPSTSRNATTRTAANSWYSEAGTKTAFGTNTKEAAEMVVERAWEELHQVFNALEFQLAGLRIRSDEAITQAQQASRRTIKTARKGLDNVLRETADILERHTGVEMPLPASVERKKSRGPPPSSYSEKIQQLFHHAAVALV